MNILIVDDSNDKIAKIVSVIRSISEGFSVDTVVNAFDAFHKLTDNKYDLLLVDLLLPQRKGDEPMPDGGKNIIKEIERADRYKSPDYIIGITQYADHISNFSNIWNTLHYAPETVEWQEKLTQIIGHVEKAKRHRSVEVEIKRPTIFLEGEIDKKVLMEAIRFFAPGLESQISLRTEKSAGASWVARQIIIWAHSLAKDENKSYIKAIGLVDRDQAGNDAKVEVNRKVDSASAGAATFRMFQLTPTQGRNLIPLYQKGVNIPVTLEELFEPSYWKMAESNGWLEDRIDGDALLNDPKGWNKRKDSLDEHFASLGLAEDERVYLKKFKTQNKDDFAKLILGLPENERKAALKNFEPLIKEMEDYLL